MNKTSPKVKIDYALVCDDVRREENGKLIIIGVYAADIGVLSYPTKLQISIILAVSSDTIGQIPIRIRILIDSNTTIEADAVMNFTVPGTGMLNLSRVPIEVTKDTVLDIQARTDQGRYKSIRKLPIRKTSP